MGTKNYFVTRHKGALDWAREEGYAEDGVEMVSHFDPSVIQKGDEVIGTLPVHLAAEVCERGGHYWHLQMQIPAEARGKELTADDMRKFDATIREFRVFAG